MGSRGVLILGMDSGGVLIIGIVVLVFLAVLFVVATTVSRSRQATGALGREARKADKSASTDVATTDMDEEARARFEATKQSLEPAGSSVPVPTAAGGLIRFEGPADPEALGVSRRMFFNRGVLAAQGLVMGSFGLACIGFLWPSASGGFGGKVNAGKLDDILDTIAEKKEPFYVPEARTYLQPYPKTSLAKAKAIYPDPVLPGMEAGLVALFQKCPHLGCRVPWCGSSQWFECPCHGSKYNRVGEKKGGPAPRGMDRWPIELNGEVVVINTGGSAVQGPAIGTNTTGQEAEGPNCV